MARAGLTPQAVVDLALAIVDEEGPDALTLAKVAQRAGVATPSLYKHVDGLPALRRAVETRTTEDLARVLNAAALGVSGDAAVRSLLTAYRDHVLAHPNRAAMLAAAPAPDDSAALAAAASSVASMNAAVREYGANESDRIHLIRALRSAMHGFAVLEAQGGFGLPQDIDTSFATLLDILVAGLAPYRRAD